MDEIFKEDGAVDQGPQGGESSEAAQEKFKENLKKTQAAIKQLKKDEGKAKSYDFSLAQFVTNLLKSGGSSQMIFLISDLIEKNVPSSFILALLSLQYSDAEKYTAKYLEASEITAIIPRNSIEKSFSDIPSQYQEDIKLWGDSIVKIGLLNPEDVFETIIQVETWELLVTVKQLTALVIKEYLLSKGVNTQHINIDLFVENFLQAFLMNLQEKIS